MSAGKILLIRGDQSLQKFAYDNYDQAHWSSAFDVILEKNGYMNFDIQDQAILEKPLDVYSMIIVPWIPEEYWTMSAIDNLLAFKGGLFLEGPISKSIAERLSLSVSETFNPDKLTMTFDEKNLSSFLKEYVSKFLVEGKLPIEPKKVLTRPFIENRWDIDFDPMTAPADFLMQRYIRAFKIVFINRLKRLNFLPHSIDNLISFYFISILSKFDQSSFNSNQKTIIYEGFNNLKPTYELNNEKHFHEYLTKQIQAYFADKDQNTTATAIKNQSLSAIPFLNIGELKDKKILHEVFLWCLMSEESDLDSLYSLKTIVAYYGKIESKTFCFNKKTSLEIAAIIAFLLIKLDERDAAFSILSQIIQVALDPLDGTLSAGYFKGVQLAKSRIFKNSSPIIPLILLVYLNTYEAPKAMHTEFGQMYGVDRIKKWQKAALYCQIINGESFDSLVSCQSKDSQKFSALIKRNNIIISSMPLLSMIVHYHTMHPLDGAFTDCDCRVSIILEAIFFYVIEQLAQTASIPLIKIEPWPWGYSYCVTLRHDVDRLPDWLTFMRLLHYQKEHKIGVTWYWIFSRLHKQYIKKQEQANHEIALHSMKLKTKQEELDKLKSCLTIQSDIYGECTHGGGGGEYWLGYPTVEYSEKYNLEYTEGVSTLYDYPYRFPYLNEDGTLNAQNIPALSHTVSIDRALTVPESDYCDFNRLNYCIKNNAYIMVLNHPDKYLDRVKEMFNKHLPQKGRLNWTCKQVSDWWKATHFRENLQIIAERDSGGKLAVTVHSKFDIQDLVIDVYDPAMKPVPVENGPWYESNVRISPSGLSFKRVRLNVINKNSFAKTTT